MLLVSKLLSKENILIPNKNTVDNILNLGSVLTRNGYGTRKIKMRIATVKEASNRKISLWTSKLNIELRKKLVTFYIWSIILYMLRDLGKGN